MTDQRNLHCSFCGRGAAEVSKLVAGSRVLLVGPRVHICDRCVGTAQEIIDRSSAAGPPAPAHGTSLMRRLWVRWAAKGRGHSERSARNPAALGA